MKDVAEESIVSQSDNDIVVEDKVEEIIQEQDHDNNLNEPKPPSRENKKARKLKEDLINKALSSDPPDIQLLRELTVTKGGLLNDEIRRKVWPKFLNLDLYEVSPKPSEEEVKNHPEYIQVDLDVQRSLRRFPPDIPKERRLALQNQLTSLIIRILIKNKDLHYYQGYHDICVTFLLVLGEELAFALLEKLSITRFRIFMEPTMESTIKFVNYIVTILERCSPEIYNHLEKGEVSPVFCLSWLITWFGHVLNDYRRIVRLYDFFLASHQLMPIYLATTVILHRREKVLALEPDMAILHHFLCNVPDNLPFEKLVQEAEDLSIEYPPEKMKEDNLIAIKSGRGFYHKWINVKTTKNTISGYVWRRLTSIGGAVIPTFVQRNWLFAVSLLIPVVLAVGWYSLYSSKIQSSSKWKNY